MKTCITCKVEKQLDQFPTRKLSDNKIGHRGECFTCKKIREKNNAEKRKQTHCPVIPREKKCSKCGETKQSNKFNKNAGRKDGLSVYCNSCQKVYFKRPERIEYDRVRNEKRKTQNNYIQYHKEYRKKNMNKFVEYNKEKYHNDPLFKLKTNYCNRIRKYIHRKIVPSKSILGCSWQTLKEHIESKFTEDMTWDNHGQYGWHLDHIIPLASAKTEEELYKLNHYTNLQPLWWRDNIIKSDKILEYTNNSSI